jgi:hypothetical protein
MNVSTFFLINQRKNLVLKEISSHSLLLNPTQTVEPGDQSGDVHHTREKW